MLRYKKTVIFSILAFLSFGFILNKQNDFFTSRANLQSLEQLDSAAANTPVLRTVKNESFKRGEKLTYRMHYGFINAGEAILQVMDEQKKIGDRNTLHVVGLGLPTARSIYFSKCATAMKRTLMKMP